MHDLCVFVYNLTLVVTCVYVGAFLHACVWKNKWVIKLHWGCLPFHNKCAQIFGTLRHQLTRPHNPRTHIYTQQVLSAMSCQSLLGLAFSLARGLDPLSEELNPGPFPPSAFQKAANKKERQTGSESQGPFMISESLYLIICWNISRAA